MNEILPIAFGQISPIWLKKEETIDKIASYISDAAQKGASLVAFGEALLPGYPFWLDKTHGAKFNDPFQKEFHALYMEQAISIENGDLDPLCKLAKEKSIVVVLGTIERASDRGNHSLYCSAVYIDQNGLIQNVHRKLMPTHEERLAWAIGDGHGLRVQYLDNFSIGMLNCWENWMPLTRAALYGQGENFHIALWPGGMHNTPDITPFIAKESRSFVLSVCGLLHKDELPHDTPARKELAQNNNNGFLSNGGSCLAAPDGTWLVEPIPEKEILTVVELDLHHVYQERQLLDPAGHYSRPDVTQLTVNRTRQNILNIKESQ